MSNLKQYFRKVSNEALEMVIPIEELPADDVTEVVSDISVIETNIDNNEEVIEVFGESLESLDSLNDILLSLGTESLDAQGYVFFKHSYDNILSTVGLESSLAVATESMDSANSYNVSMESIKETFQKIVQAVINAVVKAWNFITDFFSRLFKGFGSLLKRIAATKESARKLKNPHTDKTIKLTNASRFTYDGKFDESQIITNLSRLEKSNEYVFETYPKDVLDYFKALDNFIIKVDGHSASFADKFEDTNGFQEFVKTEMKATIRDYDKEILGGIYLRGGDVHLKKGSGNLKLRELPQFRAVPPTFERDSQFKGEELQIIKALDKADIIDALEIIEKVAKNCEAKSKVIDSIKTEAKKTIDTIADNIKLDGSRAATNPNSFITQRQLEMTTRIMLFTMGRNWSRPIAQYARYVYSIARATLALSAKSIEAYGEGFEAAKVMKDLDDAPGYSEPKMLEYKAA